MRPLSLSLVLVACAGPQGAGLPLRGEAAEAQISVYCDRLATQPDGQVHPAVVERCLQRQRAALKRLLETSQEAPPTACERVARAAGGFNFEDFERCRETPPAVAQEPTQTAPSEIKRYCRSLALFGTKVDVDLYSDCLARQQEAKARVTARAVDDPVALSCTERATAGGGLDWTAYERCLGP